MKPGSDLGKNYLQWQMVPADDNVCYDFFFVTKFRVSCRLLITLASSLNPNQDRHFVGSQFDTDVNNKGADQTVARGDFCRLLITLAKSFGPRSGPAVNTQM